MEEKECGKCLKTKLIEEFNVIRQKEGKRHYWCKQCVKEYDRQRFKDPIIKERQKKKMREYKDAVYTKMYTYLQNHPCVDCSEDNILTLEFDHITQKTYTVGAMLQRYSWEKMLEEVKKCEVVCANCHSIRTATRQNGRRLKHYMKIQAAKKPCQNKE